jgi:hypothetical protein
MLNTLGVVPLHSLAGQHRSHVLFTANLGQEAGHTCRSACVQVEAARVKVVSGLRQLQQLRDLVLQCEAEEVEFSQGLRLPTSLAYVSLNSPGCFNTLPAAISQLPSLQTLQISAGGSWIGREVVPSMAALTSLQEVSLTGELDEVPRHLAHLTGLRVLHLVDSPELFQAESSAEEMQAVLERLPALRVLCMYNCGLVELPPAVTGMVHLRTLNVDDNGDLLELPLGQYLGRLRSLSLDWALFMHQAGPLLDAATQLTKLSLQHPQRASVWGEQGLVDRVAGLLLCHPLLRLVSLGLSVAEARDPKGTLNLGLLQLLTRLAARPGFLQCLPLWACFIEGLEDVVEQGW